MKDFIESLDEPEDIERAFKKDFQALVDKYGATIYSEYSYAVEIPPVYEKRKQVRGYCYFDLDTRYTPSN